MKKTFKLWKFAQTIIPGGNGLISKRPERYCKNEWPTFFSKTKGLNVYDLDGKKFIDMAQMGVGAFILGYRNQYVDNAVKKKIDKGIGSTLNSTSEIELAKTILKVDKFADQVKFAKGGGEAMSIAVRIARAFSKKSKIIFSGYHGWHDWYLATNLKNSNNLNKHLLKGLTPLGVPKELKGTALPLEYNNEKELLSIVKNNKNIAAIVVEGCRFNLPNKNFVKLINKICREKKICLIIDEITSGWRSTVGGIYKEVGFRPDIIVYGKGIGNGYPISCVVGKRKYMSLSNISFVSSTAWTESVGLVAAKSTIEFFIKNKVNNKISTNGKFLINGWKNLAKKYSLKLSTNEYSPLATFTFKYNQKVNSKLYYYFSKQMLNYGYLASNSVYISYCHNKIIIRKYLKYCDKVFNNISKILKSNTSKLPSRSDGFKRLN